MREKGRGDENDPFLHLESKACYVLYVSAGGLRGGKVGTWEGGWQDEEGERNVDD